MNLKDYRTIFETLALDETQRDLGATIRAESGSSDGFDSLPDLPLGDTAGAHFELGAVIGRGGMGVIHLAHQSALRRDVAIKTVPHEKVTRQDVAILLQEARVMGMLEHPNVVPVHVIGRDGEKRPMIVMKRIDGTAWSEYIDGRSEIEGDALRFHIELAVSICRALAFAHDRGILHRDIKPENVMIGRFGEVYLMDWGLAVACATEIRGVPHVSAANQVVGTPAYMPGEMTTGQPLELGPRTDVALVGASLYHALTGAPPNQGNSLFAMLRWSFEGNAREYPASLPDELVEIFEQALARNPRERFSSADELREALENFLLHRNSFELVDSSRARLDALRNAAESSDIDRVHQLFGETRFGLVSALHIWPENHEARQLLDEAIRVMAHHELDHENLDSARLLIAELNTSDEALDVRLEKLSTQIAARDKRLEQLEFDYDENVGYERRRLTLGVLALVFFVSGVGALLLGSGPAPPGLDWIHPRRESAYSILVAAWILPALGLYSLVLRNRWKRHKTSRIFVRGLTVLILLGAAARSTQLSFEVPLHVALMAESAIYAGGLWILALAIDRRAGASAGFQLIAIFLMPLWPEQAYVVFSICAALSCIGFISYYLFQPEGGEPRDPG